MHAACLILLLLVACSPTQTSVTAPMEAPPSCTVANGCVIDPANLRAHGDPPVTAAPFEPIYFGDSGAYSYSDGCNTTTCTPGGACWSTAVACFTACAPHAVERSKRLAWDDPASPTYQPAHWHLEDCDFDGCTYSHCSEVR